MALLLRLCAAALLCSCCAAVLLVVCYPLNFEPAGPNSGVLGCKRCGHLQSSMLLGYKSRRSTKDRGEGSGWTMPSRRGYGDRYDKTMYPPKKHGSGHEASHGTKGPLAVKRSFLRARHRARVEGWTFYKGKLLTLAELGGDTQMQASWSPPRGRAALLPPPKLGRRAPLLSWNAGGLTTETYQDLLAWLETKQISLALIQGTRWTGDKMWTTRGYHVIQCGEPEGTKFAHSGLLTFVSSKICHADSISFSHLIPGRLMHIKCRIGHNCLDLVNIYQHPDQCSSTRPAPQEARGEVWTQLDRLLSRLAHRNLTVVAGDFNCPLPGSSKQSNHSPPDMYELTELTRKYHLGTVRAYDHTPTFVGPQGHSTIDFVLMPVSQMDAHCRTGRALQDFPVASWRETRDHLPIICSLPLTWKCWYNKPRQINVLPRATQQVLRAACQQHHPAHHTIQANLVTCVAETPPELSRVSDLVHSTLNTCYHTLKSLQPQRPQGGPNHRSLLAQLWHSYTQLRQTSSFDLVAIFNAWKHFGRLRLLKRRLSHSCKRAKVARLSSAVDQATAAAHRHDTRALFATIRKLTPRSPHRAIRLHGPSGEALTAEEECQKFRVHFSSVFRSESVTPLMPLQAFSELPFSYDELMYALTHAPVSKAVGPLALPNYLLRMMSEPLCDWLWQSLQTAWCSHNKPHIPQNWKDAWLVLLAKRRVRQATDVRPIALTDSLGRTILGLLTHALKQVVYPQITHLPIFAFVPRRGTLEALYFVCRHCRFVRTICEASSRSYWKKSTSQPLAGGLMLSLDMSQAFDRLPRAHLAAGFQRLNLDPVLVQYFMHWLHEATYHFQH